MLKLDRFTNEDKCCKSFMLLILFHLKVILKQVRFTNEDSY